MKNAFRLCSENYLKQKYLNIEKSVLPLLVQLESVLETFIYTAKPIKKYKNQKLWRFIKNFNSHMEK